MVALPSLSPSQPPSLHSPRLIIKRGSQRQPTSLVPSHATLTTVFSGHERPIQQALILPPPPPSPPPFHTLDCYPYVLHPPPRHQSPVYFPSFHSLTCSSTRSGWKDGKRPVCYFFSVNCPAHCPHVLLVGEVGEVGEVKVMLVVLVVEVVVVGDASSYIGDD